MKTVAEVPFNDLKRQNDVVGDELAEAVARVLRSGWYVLGPENERLEAALADYFGVVSCVCVGNGTDALQIALSALGVGPASTVVTAANAGGYTTTATRALGAVPVYVDVDADSHLLTAETLESAVVDLPAPPAAVVVTHLYGRSADMTSIMAWANTRGLPVVEDCAQSIGAVHAGRKAGSFGHVSTTSFYPTKNLGALGDGGAVLTSDAALAEKLRRLRQYGWASKYHATEHGGRNSRMDELQAAVVAVKLPHLDEWNEERRRIHASYEAAIGQGARLINRAAPDYVAHLAVLEVSDRSGVASLFAESGVRTEVHYPTPDHRQPISRGDDAPSLPVTESAAGRVLSVPLFPGMHDSEVQRVVDVLGELQQ